MLLLGSSWCLQKSSLQCHVADGLRASEADGIPPCTELSWALQEISLLDIMTIIVSLSCQPYFSICGLGTKERERESQICQDAHGFDFKRILCFITILQFEWSWLGPFSDGPMLLSRPLQASGGRPGHAAEACKGGGLGVGFCSCLNWLSVTLWEYLALSWHRDNTYMMCFLWCAFQVHICIVPSVFDVTFW